LLNLLAHMLRYITQNTVIDRNIFMALFILALAWYPKLIFLISSARTLDF